MGGSILKILAATVLPTVVAVILFFIEYKTKINEKRKWFWQVLTGLVFGGIAVLGTEYGINVGDYVMNARDAAPLTAGLVFGWPAGIIAGVIGGVERWFAVYWGVGTFTRLACSLGTIMAGLVGAYARVFMFDDKRPSTVHAFAIGLVAEVFHMLMVFITNMNEVQKAFGVVKQCTAVMVPMVSIGTGLAVFAVSKVLRAMGEKEEKKVTISSVFQRRLLLVFLIIFAITSFFTIRLETKLAEKNGEDVITRNMEDVVSEINEASDENLLGYLDRALTMLNRKVNITEEHLLSLQKSTGLAELCVVGSDGIIKLSTNPLFVGYDMNSGEQSREFMKLFTGEIDVLVQPYQAMSFDGKTMRKYAGGLLRNGDMLQVAYNETIFHQEIAELVIGATDNRHIMKNGFIIIASQNGAIVCGKEGCTAQDLYGAGLRNLSDISEERGFYAEVYEETSYCFYVTTEGYYIIGVIPEAELMEQRDMLGFMICFILIILFAILFFVIYRIIRRDVVDHLDEVNWSLAQITDGDLNTVVNVRDAEEFSSLSDHINQTVTTIKDYVTQAEQRIGQELEFARQIQASALPSVFPPFPQRKDFQIYALMNAAKEVGGDFYDFYLRPDNKLIILIADVSGKGVPAAMFMMTAKTFIMSLAETGESVENILTAANKKLCESNKAGMFVTCWLGALDLMTGELEFANAGHNPPVIRRDGRYEYLEEKANFVLAGMDGVKYRKQTAKIGLNDAIFLYTDGVTEATNLSKELYGEERLLDYLNRNTANTDVTAMVRGVRRDIDLFVGRAEQFDDITILMVGLMNQENMLLEEQEVRLFPAEIDRLAETLEFFENYLGDHGVPMKEIMQISVCLEELFVNVASYAYRDMEKKTGNAAAEELFGKVQITLGFTKGVNELNIIMRDAGVYFDPVAKEDPDITLSAEERKIGGLGIYMVKKTMDSVEYNRKNDLNILVMKKIVTRK